MVTAEYSPLVKSGGLGDAVAGLSKAISALGHEVRVVLPLYASIDRNKFHTTFLHTSCVHFGNGEENWIGVHDCQLPGNVQARLVDYERYFKRTGIYDEGGRAYDDNGWRFTLLCKAALQICKDEAWIPHVIHGHDWSAALCGLFLKTWDRINSPLSNVRSVLTIHNIGYQGKSHASLCGYIGVGHEHFSPDGFEDHGAVNMLKAGVNYADAVTTVSPTHARELLTPEGGHGLAPYLERHRLRGTFHGILNGVEDNEWNPAEDRLIADRYCAEDLAGKHTCKRALQMDLGLAPEADVPLFGIVTRLAEQKGVALLRSALPAALDQMSMQFVLLGSGEPDDENFFRWLESRYRGRVACWIGFNNAIAHQIYAGSDFYLMPSLYEPCGLGQLYAMRYGSVPIVRETGGLLDTVDQYNEATGEGTGLRFREATPRALFDTIGWAVSTWYDRPHHYRQLQRSAMAKRFPWSDSAMRYLEIYK